MNPIGVILLLCACANLGLATYVLSRRHSRSVHFAFSGVILAIGLWNLANFGITATNDPKALNIIGRLAFSMGCLISSGYLIFTWYFPEKHHANPSRILRLAVVVVATCITALTFTHLIQERVIFTALGKQPVFGVLYPVYVVYMLGAFMWGTFNLLRSRVRTPSGHERMQLNYIIMGFILAFVVAYIGQFVLPFMILSSDWYLALTGLSSLEWVAMATYAITRHRLMDIGIAIRTAAIHSMLAAVLLIAMMVPFILHVVFLQQSSNTAAVLSVLFVTACLAYFLPGVHARISYFVDHTIFRGRYDHKSALVKFSNHFLRPQGRDEIAAVIACELAIILQADNCSVYFQDDPGAVYSLYGYSGPDDQELPVCLPGTHPIINEVVGQQRRLIREDIAYALAHVEGTQEILAVFEQTHSEVVAPLISQGHVLGFVFLGEKKKDNLYTSDDLQLLGALTSQSAFALDNTRLYEQMLQAKNQYETILSHMQRGVLAVNAALEVTTLNDTGAEMLGVGMAEWQGRRLDEILPDFAAMLDNTLRTRENLPLTEVFLKYANRSFPCECETSVMINGKNEVSGALVVFQDLTQRKLFESEVRRMERLASVGTLAAGIAHEIKNPLVSIQTFAQLLPERFEDQEFRENFANVMYNEIERIDKLVHNLLDFARPRRGQPGNVHLHDLIERALALLGGELKKADIAVLEKLGKNVPSIMADPEQMYQVIFNLLQNAIQAFIPEQAVKKITISTKKTIKTIGKNDCEVVLLVIADTGKGIGKDDLPNIFDPFYSTKLDGSGLGLSICHSILKEHDAGIEVQSVEGKGTVFTLSLPVRMDWRKERMMRGGGGSTLSEAARSGLRAHGDELKQVGSEVDGVLVEG